MFLLLAASLHAGILCNYDGPDTSSDLLQLTDFSVAGPSELKVGSALTVEFTLENTGTQPINFTDNGIFTVTEDKDGEQKQAGKTWKNMSLSSGAKVYYHETVTVQKDGLLDLWPSYELWKTSYSPVLGRNVTLRIKGPGYWNGCELNVCPVYCENGVRYYDAYVGQDNNCAYTEYECENGCADDGVACATKLDSDLDGIADDSDNCPLRANANQKDVDRDGVGDLCDNCPSQANANQSDTDHDRIGDACEADNIPPSVSVFHAPLTVSQMSNITIIALATDNGNVSSIILAISGREVKNCSPPDLVEAQGSRYWKCTYESEPYPPGMLTYSADAYDTMGNKGSAQNTINVSPILSQGPVMANPRCLVSGTLYNFSYYSKTVRITLCEAEIIPRTCATTPPFLCFGPFISCKNGGEVKYVNATRVWSGEEQPGMPGPLEYRASVACNGTYLLMPNYQPFGDECAWRGRWIAKTSNIIQPDSSGAQAYDFTFSPEDRTPPAVTEISVPENMNALRLGIAIGGLGRYVKITASDPNGIGKVRVKGNLTATGFVSDEQGPLQMLGYPEPRRETFFSIYGGCEGSPCDINETHVSNAPFEPKSINLSLSVEVCDGAGNKRVAAFSKTYLPEGDLTIVGAEPVQVVYGAPLVQGKNTAFRIKINSTFNRAVETKIRLTLPDSEWQKQPIAGWGRVDMPPDWTYPEVWGPIKIPANAKEYEILLPLIPSWQKDMDFGANTTAGYFYAGFLESSSTGDRWPDVRVLPRPLGNESGFRIYVDPDNEIPESDEVNNIYLSPKYAVISTRNWSLLFIPYRDDNGCAPELSYMDGMAKRGVEYLLGAYPIGDAKISYAMAPVTNVMPCSYNSSLTCGWTLDGDDNIKGRAASFAHGNMGHGYDVAVVMACGSGGTSNAGYQGAVIVGVASAESILSHEFTHATLGIPDIYSLDCLIGWDEKYCEYPDGTRTYYCYDDEKNKKDGYVGPRCVTTDNGTTIFCTNYAEKNCVGSCGCSIYRANTECKKKMTANNALYSHATCDSECCNGIANQTCTTGEIYTGPDGRIRHPASDGLWTNKWVATSESMNYYMDSNWPEFGKYPYYWNRLGNTVEHCSGQTLDDGYLNMLKNDRFLDENDPEALLVRGIAYSNGSVELEPFIYLPNSVLDLEPGSQGNYTIVLLDAQGKELGISGFNPLFWKSDPNGGPVDEVPIVYRVEWKNGTKRIEVRDANGAVLAVRSVSEHAPELSIVSPKSGETFAKASRINISWSAKDADADALSFSLYLKESNGTWGPLVMDLETETYELDSSGLVEGSYILAVQASDGVNTARAFSSPFGITGQLKNETPYAPAQQNETGTQETKEAGNLWVLYTILLVSCALVLIWVLLRRKKL
ncbi:MAG: thrombospondin type 3 repeat-containing protein [Candidatus Micrarchaeota archaeon]